MEAEQLAVFEPYRFKGSLHEFGVAEVAVFKDAVHKKMFGEISSRKLAIGERAILKFCPIQWKVRDVEAIEFFVLDRFSDHVGCILSWQS